VARRKQDCKSYIDLEKVDSSRASDGNSEFEMRYEIGRSSGSLLTILPSQLMWRAAWTVRSRHGTSC
jgi:hypothetical protein